MSLCACRPRSTLCGTCRAIRDRLAAEHPACVHCGKPCVTGQKDAAGRDAHCGCQLESIDGDSASTF